MKAASRLNNAKVKDEFGSLINEETAEFTKSIMSILFHKTLNPGILNPAFQ